MKANFLHQKREKYRNKDSSPLPPSLSVDSCLVRLYMYFMKEMFSLMNPLHVFEAGSRKRMMMMFKE